MRTGNGHGILLFLLVSVIGAGLGFGQKPFIDSLSPEDGVAGDKIRIFGGNFENLMGITFNGTAATQFNVTAQNQLEVTIPAGAKSGPISIQNTSGIGISSQSMMIFNPGPRPLTFSPASGLVGETITIEGSLFTTQTRVLFSGGVQALITSVLTESKIQVVVPHGAESGPVTLFDSRGSNESLESFQVVVLNNLRFLITTPAQALTIGEETVVDWEVQSLNGAASTSAELTLLIPDSGIIFDRVSSDKGQVSQNGRFIQISQVNIVPGEVWHGSLHFIPIDPQISFSFEGSVASAERDPDLTNNNMVQLYSGTIRPVNINVSLTGNGQIKLDWPAYPDDWKLSRKTKIGRLSFWETVAQQPFTTDHRKVLILSPESLTSPFSMFRLQR